MTNTCQNRNCILANAILQFAMEYKIKVVQKYLVMSHTQMAYDSVHAIIENYIRRRNIHLPGDFVFESVGGTAFPTTSVKWNSTILRTTVTC